METELPGTPIGAGRSADVYDVGGGRVLRRYRDGRDADAVQREAEVMAHARAHGVPVPGFWAVPWPARGTAWDELAAQITREAPPDAVVRVEEPAVGLPFIPS